MTKQARPARSLTPIESAGRVRRNRREALTMPPTSTDSLPDSSGAKGGKAEDFRKLFGRFGLSFSPNCSANNYQSECPFCHGERFFLNAVSGQWDCKQCRAEGNRIEFLTEIHRHYLDQTSAEHYSTLGKMRGIKPQTLRNHGLAFDPMENRWLVPFRNARGNVVTIQFYYPDRPKDGERGNKENLPGPTALYGFDRLTAADKSKIVLLCEGPFDAVALDYHIGDKSRPKYAIVAAPGQFKAEWAEHFRDRKVRVLFDNDDSGREQSKKVAELLGDSGVAKELKVLRWPDGFPPKCDINDLVRDKGLREGHGIERILGWALENSFKVVAEPKLTVFHGRRAKDDDEEIEWVWPNRLRCGTYASLSGPQGVFKSTIVLEVTARYSKGLPMPLEKAASMPAGHVLVIFAEDNRKAVEDAFERAGGDFDKWHCIPATVKDGGQLNILEHLPEIEKLIREFNIRLVIIDGQNSVVGAPKIMTDMLARTNVTNKLHHFAQKLDVCLVGIRNEDAEGRALGPQSVGDIARCVLRAYETEPKGDPPYCVLKFVKVSDTARTNYPPIPYSVANLGGSHRKILWGKSRPKPEAVPPAVKDRAKATAAAMKKTLDAKSKAKTGGKDVFSA